jgi:hypothetical protein
MKKPQGALFDMHSGAEPCGIQFLRAFPPRRRCHSGGVLQSCASRLRKKMIAAFGGHTALLLSSKTTVKSSFDCVTNEALSGGLDALVFPETITGARPATAARQKAVQKSP